MVNFAAFSSVAVAALLLSIILQLYYSPPQTTTAPASPEAQEPAQATTTPPKTTTIAGGAAEAAPYPRYDNITDRSKARIFSVKELAAHDGEDRSKPLLLAILGDVFDVGPGERFYAPKQGYSQMGGCDASRSFVDLTEKGKSSSLEGLPASEVAEVMRWRNEFYRPHKEYRFVGVLHDLYYNEKGEPTIALMKLEQKQKGSANADEERKKLEKRFMSCNSKHESGKPNIQLWCDDSYHPKGSSPVHLYFRLPAAVEGEDPEKGNRCACVPAADRAAATSEAKSQAVSTTFKFVEYVDCQSSTPQRCDRPKGNKPPPED